MSVTISIGVAEREAHQRNADEVIRAADKALYTAKHAGRNCVQLAPDATTGEEADGRRA